ncbi:Esa1p-associated factor, variant 2 [Puccinia graminis f. sp. tritici]|uniref:Chromatin modification-related protein EAF3 n=1 Tax=Puccinia graminis f. sp. tritici TaxID=56615 RepID=A0A5B0SG88_PUCGR|nr:Esa1p-associated factor, variant 2 [Puccinia graminis f. sp. tritici]
MVYVRRVSPITASGTLRGSARSYVALHGSGTGLSPRNPLGRVRCRARGAAGQPTRLIISQTQLGGSQIRPTHRIIPPTNMPKMEFSASERVLCYHGPLLYEARVLKVKEAASDEARDIPKGNQYWIHYKGWKQKWDEWVSESRLLKLTEENLRLERSLNENHRVKEVPDKSTSKDAKNNDPRPTTNSDKGKKVEGRGTKRSRDSVCEPEEGPSKQPVTIVIPEPLKIQLVDDWEAVTRQNQVVSLPRTPTVKSLLEEYERYAVDDSTTPQAKNLIKEVNAGLKVYFDKSLGYCLLYRNERQQYIEIRKKLKGKLASEIYGAEHLLRLIGGCLISPSS